MKRTLLIIIGLLFVLHSVAGQSKVAVLDASLGEGVHANASAIVADTINEQFVKSADFIAIDRAYISSIQEEKQFQISGEVNAKDIKELGITFGAKYICIANVSLLGNTYSVSVRLIEVETAQVVAQESARMQGQIDVLFDIAEIVGNKLMGKELTVTPTPQAVPEETAPPAKPAPVKQTSAARPGEKRSHFTVGYMLSGFMGLTSGTYTVYGQDEYVLDNFIVDDAQLKTWGIDTHMMIPLNNIYWSLGATYTNQTLVVDDFSGTYSYENFSTVNATTGIGLIYPAGVNFQLYGGVNLGYLVLILGNDYSGDATFPWWDPFDGESAGGFALGVELGLDYFLGDFCISARYKLSRTGDLTGDYIFTDAFENSGGDTSFGVHGLVIGVGYTWNKSQTSRIR